MRNPRALGNSVLNIAIVSLAVLVIMLCLNRYSLKIPPGSSTSSGGDPRLFDFGLLTVPGMVLPLADVNWSYRDGAVVFVLAHACEACADNMAVYRRLSQEARANNIGVIAVFSDSPRDAHAYLNREGIFVDEVKQATLESLGAPMTPSVFLMDSQGIVKKAWFGKLRHPESVGLLSRQNLANTNSFATLPDHLAATRRLYSITAAKLLSRMSNEEFVLVDVRDRADHATASLPGSINIPADEIDIRATNELPKSLPIIVYSTTTDQLSIAGCLVLTANSFPRVALLVGGLQSWQDAGYPLAGAHNSDP